MLLAVAHLDGLSCPFFLSFAFTLQRVALKRIFSGTICGLSYSTSWDMCKYIWGLGFKKTFFLNFDVLTFLDVKRRSGTDLKNAERIGASQHVRDRACRLHFL